MTLRTFRFNFARAGCGTAAAGILVSCLAPPAVADLIQLNTNTGSIFDVTTSTTITAINGVPVLAIGGGGASPYTWDVLGDLNVNAGDTLTLTGSAPGILNVANNVNVAAGGSILINAGTAGGGGGAGRAAREVPADQRVRPGPATARRPAPLVATRSRTDFSA